MQSDKFKNIIQYLGLFSNPIGERVGNFDKTIVDYIRSNKGQTLQIRFLDPAFVYYFANHIVFPRMDGNISFFYQKEIPG